MFRKLPCNNCGYKLRFNRKDNTWYCDNCFHSITMEEMVQQQYGSPSEFLSSKTFSRIKLAIILSQVLFVIIVIVIVVAVLSIRYKVTIEVYSKSYNGPIKIFYHGDEVFSGEIIVGETIEKTISVSNGRHYFSVQYGDETLYDVEEIDSDETVRFRI